MQKGFAALELVIAIFVVSLLLSCAVPNAARIVDRVSLDCEVKRLYTELRYIQSFDRMGSQVRVIVYPKKYRVERNADSTLYYGNDFLNGVTADKGKVIRFDDMGKISPATSDTLTLTSRRGKSVYFIFDSVGRFRAGRTRPK